MSALRVVLLGVLGHGKTSLFNKVTNAKEATPSGGNSVTKQIVIAQSVNEEFEIIDTPGFGTLEDKLLHAAGVIAGLAQGDVNRIIIVVKHERVDLMKQNIKPIIGLIQRYKDLITIVVSHWDIFLQNIKDEYQNQESQQKQELNEQELIETKIKNYFNISSVIFYSKKLDDPIIITNKITKIIVQSRFDKIKLQESEIFGQLDLLSLSDGSQLEFNNRMSKIKIKFRVLSVNFLKYIESLKLDDKDLIDKLHFISLQIKSIANEYLEKFEKQYGDYMNDTYDTDGINVRYLHHIYLKKELRMDLEEVIKQAQSKMKESQKNCFHWIKQCPYCGLVWMKVIGCDSETRCGNRVNSSLDDLMNLRQKQNRFEIIMNSDSVDIKVLEEKNQTIIQGRNVYKILYNSVLDDPVFKNNFSLRYGNINQNSASELNQVIEEFVISFLGSNRLNYYIENINEVDQKLMINEFKLLLREFGWLQNEYQTLGVNEQKSLGCGKTFVWKDLLPLSEPLEKELLSSELLDYLNDHDQLLRDEADYLAKELERTYRDLVNQAIKEQLKNIKVIQKRQNLTETLNDTEKQKQEQQSENLKSNYCKHIENTKIEQKNIRRRFLDHSLFSVPKQKIVPTLSWQDKN